MLTEIQIALICAILVIILIVLACMQREEDFATVEDKATQLSKWMRAHPGAPYVDFIRANPDSNIVEYTKMRTLYTTHRLGSKSAVEALRV